MTSKKTPAKPAMKTNPKARTTEKAGGLGAPSGGGSVGPSVPSGDAAPGPRRGGSNAIAGTRPDVGHAHERVGMSGEHAMAVPGMPNGQGGNRNPNRVTSSASRIENSTPAPNNSHGNAEPTNPRYQPEIGPGSGGSGTDAQPGQPPSSGMLAVPDPNHPMGRLPNNPRGETTVPTERAPRPRMY